MATEQDQTTDTEHAVTNMKYDFSEPPQPTHYLGQVGDSVLYPSVTSSIYGSRVVHRPQLNLPNELLALLTPEMQS